MKRICLITLLTLGICLIAQVVAAENAYVTDTFRISLRRGPSVENKILKFLPSGLLVNIQESKEGWDRIQVQEGENIVLEGWVLSRYLIDRLPWKMQTESLLQENATLKEELAGIQKESNQKLLLSQARIKELTVSYENRVKTDQSSAADNESLESAVKVKLFVMGAVVLFVGMLIGRMASRPEKRRIYYQ